MRYSYDTEALEEEIFGRGIDEAEEGEAEPEAEEFLDTEDPVAMSVTLEDGTSMEYMVAGVFLEGEKEYIALETGEGDIHIMELLEGEKEEIRLLPIEDKEEQERVMEAFSYYFEQPRNENQAESENEDDRDQDRQED